MKGLTFDQVERYRSAGLVLGCISTKLKKKDFNVLDLGGYFETNDGSPIFPIRTLFPQVNSTVADVTECQEKGYRKLMPGEALPFKDKSFSVTVCLDVLEHIPQDQRREFVSEALRVTSDVLVLGAPFYHPSRVEADRWLSVFYESIMKCSNKMLDEHLENGLPDPTEFEGWVKELDVASYHAFPNGDLSAWRLIMAVKHLLIQSCGPDIAMEMEKNLLPLAEPVVLEGPGYRDAYVLMKCKSNLSLSVDDVKKELMENKKTQRNKRRKKFAETVETICSQYLLNVGNAVQEFGNTVTGQNQSIKNLQIELARAMRQIKMTTYQHEQFLQNINFLNLSLREKDLYINELLNTQRSKDEDFEKHVAEYEQGLSQLQNSVAFKTGKLTLAPIKAAAKLIKKLRDSRAAVQAVQANEEGQVINNPEKGQVINPDPRITLLSHEIKFSILVPVYNTDKNVLEAMLQSVMAQNYPNWELCLVDDASPNETPRQVLQSYHEQDPDRILIHFAKTNGGIAVSTRKAAEMASGEFICLLDHDDLLHSDALLEMALQLEVTPNADYIYSDENKISNDGREFSQPYYKPEFDPDLLLCNNYLNHFSVIRKTLFDDIGGYREGFDGSQDYDLYLRVTEKARHVAHVPKILYHWRMVPESTAADPAAKGGLYRESSFKVLESAIQRRGLDATVEMGLNPGSYRVKYNVKPDKKVSIIIPTRDAVELVEQCVSTVEKFTAYPNYEIVIVDNGSTDEQTLEYLTRKSTESTNFKWLKYHHRFNFSELNNYAVQLTDAPYLLFLNNDIEVTSKGWLTAMLEHAQRDDVGAVGAKLLYPDGRIQHAGVILGMGGIAGHPFKELPEHNGVYFGHSNLVKNYSAVTAACLLMRREVFEDIGGYNEELAVSFGDIDLCLEIVKRGYRIIYTPYSRLIHHESVSRLDDNDDIRRPRFHGEITYMISKWGQVLYNDPFLNPNLSILKTDMSRRDEGENRTLEAFQKAFSGFIPGM